MPLSVAEKRRRALAVMAAAEDLRALAGRQQRIENVLGDLAARLPALAAEARELRDAATVAAKTIEEAFDTSAGEGSGGGRRA